MTNYDFSGENSNDSEVDVPVRTGGVFEEFLSDIQKDPDLPETIDLKVPGRNNFAVRYDTDLEMQQLDRWRKASTPNRKRPNDIDSLLLAQHVLTGACVGIVRNGELVKSPSGETLDFRSEAVLSSLGVLDPHAAIKKLYTKDAYIISASNDVIAAAGFGEEDDDEEDGPLDV